MDGVIEVHETIHSLKWTRQPGMLIKLDIVKPYEKISWKFLEKMLRAYGFSSEWVEWFMALVITPFFSVLLNSSPTKLFSSTREISQGDLLPHFLFILMEESLSKLTQTQTE